MAFFRTKHVTRSPPRLLAVQAFEQLYDAAKRRSNMYAALTLWHVAQPSFALRAVLSSPPSVFPARAERMLTCGLPVQGCGVAKPYLARVGAALSHAARTA